jgi:hypothetical protein
MPQPEVPNSMALQHCRVWLKWAAAHLEECLTRDSLANGDLLHAVAEMLGSQQPDTAAPSTLRADSTGRQMAAVVVAVQSHDRVIQGLAHVAGSLHALHAQLGDARLANSADAWRTLRDTQFRAFSMAEERALFARMVAPGDGAEPEAELTPDDTVELFTGSHGLVEP